MKRIRKALFDFFVKPFLPTIYDEVQIHAIITAFLKGHKLIDVVHANSFHYGVDRWERLELALNPKRIISIIEAHEKSEERKKALNTVRRVMKNALNKGDTNMSVDAFTMLEAFPELDKD